MTPSEHKGERNGYDQPQKIDVLANRDVLKILVAKVLLACRYGNRKECPRLLDDDATVGEIHDIDRLPNPEKQRRTEAFRRARLSPVGPQNDFLRQERRAFEATCSTTHERLEMTGGNRPGARHPVDMDAKTESWQSGTVFSFDGPSGDIERPSGISVRGELALCVKDGLGATGPFSFIAAAGLRLSSSRTMKRSEMRVWL